MSLVKVLDWGTILYQCPTEPYRFCLELSDERGAAPLVAMPVEIKEKLLALPEKEAQWVLGGVMPNLPVPLGRLFAERLADLAKK